VLLPSYFAEVYQNPTRARGLQYMMMAIGDIRLMVDRCLNYSATLVQDFEKEVSQALTDNIIAPLGRDIETDLRLHIHSHLKLDDRNPFHVGLVDRTPLLEILPLHFFNHTVDIKSLLLFDSLPPFSPVS